MLVGNAWGIHAIKADAQGKRAPTYMPTGQVTMLYSKHHGDKLLALDSRNVPTYEQPYQMGGISPKPKIAFIDALATADEEHVYFHAINRSFEQPIEVAIDVSAFGLVAARAVHHVLEGRLNDTPGPNESPQIATINEGVVHVNGATLRVTLPHRSVSCIEFTLI